MATDVAEMSVKLIKDFASPVTVQERQLQQLPQVVEKLRRELTDFSRSSLARLRRRLNNGDNNK